MRRPPGSLACNSVEVQASPFDSAHSDSSAALAVRSLPGVTSNNDFDARFSLRGAASVGLVFER